ncbi:hypothetical protein PQX77_001467 [Marasmius sp. AFHP31]|nr:hypothetical protein PQX77_001467 [Marasmius sp. AFHP31]
MHPQVRRFVDGLEIPSYRGSRYQPDFLLEGLESAGEDIERRRRSKNLFRPGKHTLIVNTSGSGKTRSLLEAMAQNWGFYFICRDPRHDGLGSSDMFEVFDRLFKEDPQFRPNHFYSFNEKALPHEEEQVLANNVGVARRLFIPVLLARLILFRQFIELMVSHMSTSAAGPSLCGPYYLRWLYLQLHPSILDIPRVDVFSHTAETIRTAFGDDVGAMAYWVIATMEALQPLLRQFEDQATVSLRARAKGKKDGSSTDVTDLFIVIDEAQDAAEAFPHAFRSALGLTSRPALRQLVVIWGNDLQTMAANNGVDFSWTFIITGTGMSVNLVRDAIASTSAKHGPFSDFHSIGAFEQEAEQVTYIRKYVPQCVLETSSGKLLVERMGFWLTGRLVYRFTAQFLAFLLECGYQQPNTLLNIYLTRFGGFDPTDCPKCILSEEENAGHEGPNPIRSFSLTPRNDLESLDWGSLRTDSTSRILVQDITYKYMLTSALNQSLGMDNWKLLEYGFARMPDKSRGVQLLKKATRQSRRAAVVAQTKSALLNPVVDERLVLLSCAVWLNNGSTSPPSKPIYTLHEWLSRRLNIVENNHSGFEDHVAYAFLLAFGTTPVGGTARFTVGDIFKFFGQSRSLDRLKKKEATLISIHHPRLHHNLPHCYHYDHGEVLFTEEGKIRGYPAAIGLGDLDNNKLMDWLRGDQPQMFCFPPTEMGPDLIFVLKLYGDDDGAEDDLDDVEDVLADTFDPDRDSSSAYVWVAVQVKTHSTTSLSKSDTKKAVRSITPSQWWSDSKNHSQSDDDSSSHVSIRDTRKPRSAEHQRRYEETMELIDGLKCRETELAGKHSVIRAVASFPSAVKFSRHLCRPKRVDHDADDDETIDNEHMDGMIPEELQAYRPLFDEDDDAIMDDDSGQSRMQSMTGTFPVANGWEDPSKYQDPDGDDGHPLAWVNFQRIVEITKSITPKDQLVIFGGDKLERAKSKRLALRSTSPVSQSPQSLQDFPMGGPQSPPPKPSKRIEKATSRAAVHRPPVAGPSRPKNQLLGHRI